MANADDETLVTVATFQNIMEAIVARASLQAAGIECFLPDEHSTYARGSASQYGGARLQVGAGDVTAAREVLAPVD